jgi:cell division protein FtsB
MFARLKLFTKSPLVRRRLVLIGIVAVLLWVMFFDSHSVLKRLRWSAQANELEKANTELRVEIEQLETDIGTASSPEVVEKVAREQYGMRRPGETVYRVEESTTGEDSE